MEMLKNMFPDPSDYPSARLFSLDALRGLDMIVLTVFGPVVCAAQGAFACFSSALMNQIDHRWQGFTFWDIIMPLFIFMCGAAIPFALGRRLKEGSLVFWRHVLVRVALLWFLGGLVQGNWAELNPQTFSPFANTLQSIAVGYLATAAMMTVPSRAFQIACPVVLSVGYALLLAVGGDYSETGNLAARVDHAILSAILPATNSYVAQPSVYAWFLPSMMFAAMTMCGYHATMILRSAMTAWKKAGALFSYAAALFAAGAGASVWIPLSKPIYTFSFTALAMGWCVLALAVLYVVCDIWKLRRGTSLVLLFGQNALTAYFVSSFFAKPLNALAETVLPSVTTRCEPKVAAFCVAVLSVVELVAILVVKRRFAQMRH